MTYFLLGLIFSLVVFYISADWPPLLKTKPKPSYEHGESNEEPKHMPPGNIYEHYNHSSEGEHRTAEQFNWRWQNTLTKITILFAATVAFFAIKTYGETKRQADAACKAYEPTLIVGNISLYRLTPKPNNSEVPDFQVWVEFLNIGGNSAVANSWAINVSQDRPSIPYRVPTKNYKRNINVFFRPTTDIKDASPVPLFPEGLTPKVLDSIRGSGIPKYWIYGYIKYRDTWNRSYIYNFCQTTHMDGIVVGESIPPEGEAIPIESCSTEEYGDYVSQADTQRISTARVSQNGC